MNILPILIIFQDLLSYYHPAIIFYLNFSVLDCKLNVVRLEMILQNRDLDMLIWNESWFLLIITKLLIYCWFRPKYVCYSLNKIDNQAIRIDPTRPKAGWVGWSAYCLGRQWFDIVSARPIGLAITIGGWNISWRTIILLPARLKAFSLRYS